MKSIDLIQPRHNYAPPLESGKTGHIYTNGSLWNIGAQLLNNNIDVNIHDENIKKATITSDIVGINLLGSPYIPQVINLINRIKDEVSKDITFVLGGQVLQTGKAGITDEQFQQLFGENVYNGMDQEKLSKIGLGLEGSEYNTSLISIYEKMNDIEFLQYFSHEISLFVSQGCSQKCSFCAAAKGIPERYRDHSIVYYELQYILQRLSRLEQNSLSIYMSNLDVFQTPLELTQFVQSLESLKQEFPHFTFTLRGLAGVPFFMKVHKHYPALIKRLADVGFSSVGYGVDGIGKDIWMGIKKPQNNEQNVLDTIRLTREEYGITPELLMVFGHDHIDTEKSLGDAYDFTEHMVNKYKAVPRPHIAKTFIPGNDGRQDPRYENTIDKLIKNPYLFQALDFTAVANNITHTDQKLIPLVNKFYEKICKLPGNTTKPIIAYEPHDTLLEREHKDTLNLEKYDR